MKRLLAAVLLVAACSASPNAVAPVDEATGWTRSPNFTTCAQWDQQMTQSQRVQMARDLLPILRQTVDTQSSSGEEMASDFATAISSTCASPEVAAAGGDEYVITAAATLAFMGTERFQE